MDETKIFVAVHMSWATRKIMTLEVCLRDRISRDDVFRHGRYPHLHFYHCKLRRRLIDQKLLEGSGRVPDGTNQKFEHGSEHIWRIHIFVSKSGQKHRF